jgi:hypothetical protein
MQSTYDAPGINVCINGDCSLPGETSFLDKDCKASVSVFTVDYDAPDVSGPQSKTAAIRSSLGPLVQYNNATSFVGGLNGTSVILRNVTGTTAPTTSSSVATGIPAFTGAAAAPAVHYLFGLGMVLWTSLVSL